MELAPAVSEASFSGGLGCKCSGSMSGIGPVSASGSGGLECLGGGGPIVDLLNSGVEDEGEGPSEVSF